MEKIFLAKKIPSTNRQPFRFENSAHNFPPAMKWFYFNHGTKKSEQLKCDMHPQINNKYLIRSRGAIKSTYASSQISINYLAIYVDLWEDRDMWLQVKYELSWQIDSICESIRLWTRVAWI